MGRKRTRVTLFAADRDDLHRRLCAARDPRERERLRMVRDALTGRYTLEDLARRAGRARATIQLWLAKLHHGGIAELLKRDTPPGAASPLATRHLHNELQAGLDAGRWRSAHEIATWLEDVHGIRRARKSIYYWLTKNGWRAPGACPRQTSAKGLGATVCRPTRSGIL